MTLAAARRPVSRPPCEHPRPSASITFSEAATQWLPRAPKLRNPKSDEIRAARARSSSRANPRQGADLGHAGRPRRNSRSRSSPRRRCASTAPPKPCSDSAPRCSSRRASIFGRRPTWPNFAPWAGRRARAGRTSPCQRWTGGARLNFWPSWKPRQKPIARLFALILATTSRCKPARLAKRRNIDLKTKTWTIPIDDLKDSEHRTEPFVVPLNDVALAAISPGRGEYVFTDERGKPFTDRDITNFTRKLRRRHPDWTDPKTGRAFTMHGCRSTFRSCGRGDPARPRTGRTCDGARRLRGGRRRLRARPAPRAARRTDAAVGPALLR